MLLGVAKTKALISFAVSAKLIWVFVFANAKSRFSHNEAHLYVVGRGFRPGKTLRKHAHVIYCNFSRL